MATITAIASTEEGGIRKGVVSAEATLATPDLVVELDETTSGLDLKDFAHVYLCIKMLTVADVQVVGTAGLFTVQIKTDVNGVFEAPPQATINAATPRTIDFRGPITAVQVTEDGNVTGNSMTKWAVHLAAFRS